jgi:hypothetical protein
MVVPFVDSMAAIVDRTAVEDASLRARRRSDRPRIEPVIIAGCC